MVLQLSMKQLQILFNSLSRFTSADNFIVISTEIFTGMYLHFRTYIFSRHVKIYKE